MVRLKANDESGFTLVQTMATIIMVSLLGTGLIFLGFQVSQQVSATQKISQRKNQKTYASQEAKLTLDKELETLFSYDNLQKNPLGTNDSVLRKLMSQFMIDHRELNDGVYDKEDSVTFKNNLEDFSIESISEFTVGEDDEQGWNNGFNINSQIGIYSYRITIPVKSTLTDETGGSYTVTSDYCYEIQWESKSEGTIVSEADIWGNVYYQINRPGGIQYLSADTMMRKMAKIYHYQDATPDYLESFPDDSFGEKVLNGSYGIQKQYVSDVSDERKIFNKNVNHLSFEGSFILENGFALKGDNQQAEITTKNLMALTNDANSFQSLSDNFIRDLSLDARTGLYLALDTSDSKRSQSIVIDNSGGQVIETPNLLINQTISDSQKDVGTFINSGVINVVPSNKPSINFRQYKGNSNQINTQMTDWEHYQNGNLVISQSKVILEPKGNRNAPIKLNVANNFMLTNASMDAHLDEDSFSYFQKDSKEKIKKPSELLLSGSDTVMTVNGYSYLDSPKRNQRPLLGEKVTEKSNYVLGQGLNRVELKEGSKMLLNYTGVESFDLSVEKDSVFSMKVLPGCELFNDTFLNKGFASDKLNGKVVLETYQAEDKELLIQKFEANQIPYKVVSNLDKDFQNCDNGVVTIYDAGRNKVNTSYEFITRNFSYMMDVSY